MRREVKRLIIGGVVSGVFHAVILCTPLSLTPGIVEVREIPGPVEVSLVDLRQVQGTSVPRRPQPDTVAVPPQQRVEAATRQATTAIETLTETMVDRGPQPPRGEVPGRAGDSTGTIPRYDGNPKPPYPLVARQREYEGTVRLEVAVLSSGRVGGIRVWESSGHEVLDRSALNTVKGWHFIPATIGGVAVESTWIIPITFRIEARREARKDR